MSTGLYTLAFCAEVLIVPVGDEFKVRVTFLANGRVAATMGQLARTREQAEDAAVQARAALKVLGVEVNE